MLSCWACPHRKGGSQAGKVACTTHICGTTYCGDNNQPKGNNESTPTHKRLQEIEKTMVRKRLVSKEDKETLTTIPDQYASRVYDVHILSHPQSHTIVHIVHETHDY